METDHNKKQEESNVDPRIEKYGVKPDEVYKLASYYCSYREIGDFFGVCKDTIQRHFDDEVQSGRSALKRNLRRVQIEKALEGDVKMLVFLGKQYLGQSENGDSDGSKEILPWMD